MNTHRNLISSSDKVNNPGISSFRFMRVQDSEGNQNQVHETSRNKCAVPAFQSFSAEGSLKRSMRIYENSVCNILTDVKAVLRQEEDDINNEGHKRSLQKTYKRSYAMSTDETRHNHDNNRKSSRISMTST